jgi:hypothetical protein
MSIILTHNPRPAHQRHSCCTRFLERLRTSICRRASSQDIIDQKDMHAIKALHRLKRALHCPLALTGTETA